MTLNPHSKDPVRSQLELLLPELKGNLVPADYCLVQTVLEYARSDDLEKVNEISAIYRALLQIRDSPSPFYRYTKNYKALGTTISLIRGIITRAYIVPESEEKQSHL